MFWQCKFNWLLSVQALFIINRLVVFVIIGEAQNDNYCECYNDYI